MWMVKFRHYFQPIAAITECSLGKQLLNTKIGVINYSASSVSFRGLAHNRFCEAFSSVKKDIIA